MKSAPLALVLIFASTFSLSAFARDFNFKEASFGTYVRGEYGLAQSGDASYGSSSGKNVSFDSSRSSNLGGEFGLLFAGEKLTFRLAVGLLMPKTLTGVNGSSSGGTSYYAMDSKVTGFLPEAGFDFVMKQFPASRLLLSVGGGVAVVTTSNAYKFTTAGTAQFPTLTDHTETGKGQGLAVQIGGAYEMLFSDRATFVVDLGYRYCKIASLTAADPVTTFTGTYAAGDKLKTNDGSDRTLDLGGFMAGAGFRFYF